MRLMRLALCWLLGLVASRLPQRPEKSAHEPTLPEELQASLTRLIGRLRAKIAEEELATGQEQEEQAAEGAAVPLKQKAHHFFAACKQKLSFLSKLNSFPAILSILLILTGVVYATLFFSFSSTPDINPEDDYRLKSGKPLVRVGYVQEWPSSEALARLMSVLISRNMNAEVMLKPYSQNDPEEVFKLMGRGEVDIFPTAWMPDTHGGIVETLQEAGYIIDLGAIVRGARLGLAVPDYMKVKDIAGLTKAEYGGIIYGIDPASKLNRMAKDAQELYGLKGVRLVEKTDYYALLKLQEALKAKRNIVLATWEPNWIFGKYALHMLDDPMNAFGGQEDLHVTVSKKFADTLPRVSECIGLIKLNMRELNTIMARVHDTSERSRVIADWLQENRMRVRVWLEPLRE